MAGLPRERRPRSQRCRSLRSDVPLEVVAEHPGVAGAGSSCSSTWTETRVSGLPTPCSPSIGDEPEVSGRSYRAILARCARAGAIRDQCHPQACVTQRAKRLDRAGKGPEALVSLSRVVDRDLRGELGRFAEALDDSRDDLSPSPDQIEPAAPVPVRVAPVPRRAVEDLADEPAGRHSPEPPFEGATVTSEIPRP